MVSSPKPPDPVKTAEAQSQINKETAVTQYGLNATNQTTPYGNLTYKQIGTWDDGTPRFEATQTLSPENQQLYDQYMSLANTLGGIGNTQANAVSGTLGSPFNFEAEQAKKLTDIQNTFLDPQWSQQQEALETQLANQGVQPGTEAYRRAMEEFSSNRQRAYDQNYLSAYQTAGQQALTERNQPLNELSALMSGTQVQQPSYSSTPNVPVSGVDYAGLVQNNYQQQLQNHNAMMGGIFGLGSTLGGWALSDRRYKHNIRRVGKLDNGADVYTFTYTPYGATHMGVMADEIEKIAPEAVMEIGGKKHVRYDMVA